MAFWNIIHETLSDVSLRWCKRFLEISKMFIWVKYSDTTIIFAKEQLKIQHISDNSTSLALFNNVTFCPYFFSMLSRGQTKFVYHFFLFYLQCKTCISRWLIREWSLHQLLMVKFIFWLPFSTGLVNEWVLFSRIMSNSNKLFNLWNSKDWFLQELAITLNLHFS